MNKNATTVVLAAIAALALAGCTGNTGNGYNADTITETTKSGRTVECVTTTNHNDTTAVSCDWDHSTKATR